MRFDDWMFLQDAEVMINRARVTKWGIGIGEATIVFRRVGAEASGALTVEQPALAAE